MKAILQKEWHGYFSTVTGYLFTAFLMLFAGIFFSVLCLTGGLPSFEYVLSNMTFVFVPGLRMKSGRSSPNFSMRDSLTRSAIFIRIRPSMRRFWACWLCRPF